MNLLFEKGNILACGPTSLKRIKGGKVYLKNIGKSCIHLILLTY